MVTDQVVIDLLMSRFCLWKRPRVPFGVFLFSCRGGKFIEPDEKKRSSVHCKMCKQELSYKGNTTNMLVHLQYMYNHQREYNDLKAIDSGVTGHKQASQHPTITKAFEQLAPIPKDSLQWRTLTESVCYCIAKDMLPLSCVIQTHAQNL